LIKCIKTPIKITALFVNNPFIHAYYSYNVGCSDSSFMPCVYGKRIRDFVLFKYKVKGHNSVPF